VQPGSALEREQSRVAFADDRDYGSRRRRPPDDPLDTAAEFVVLLGFDPSIILAHHPGPVLGSRDRDRDLLRIRARRDSRSAY